MLLFDDSKKLEKALGEEAAAVIAHVLERADDKWRQDLATKADLENGLLATKTELQKEISAVRVEMQTIKNELIKWMVGSVIALGAFLFAAMALFK